MRNTWKRPAAVLVTVGLVLGACGGDDDDNAGSGTVAEESEDTAASESTGAPADSSPAETSVDDGQPVAGIERLVIAHDVEPQTLDLGDTIDAQLETWQLLDPILLLREDGTFEPQLASELPTADPDNSQSFTVPLRDDVVFHDGTPLTAQAVVEWIEYLATYDARTREIVDIALAVTPTAIDEHTLGITFNTPGNDGINSVLSRFLIGKQTADSATNPIGTGPYRLTEWNRGQNMVLERFDDYYGEQPAVATVEFRYIPDAGSRIAAIQAGEVDIVSTVSVDDIAAVPHVITGPSPRWVTWLPDAKGKFADVRLRHALSMAIDTEAILDALFGGIGNRPECQLGVDGYTGFNPELEAYPFDMDRARELVAEAGAEGLEFEVLTATNQPKFQEIAESAVAAWQEIGLSPTLTILPFDQFVPIITSLEEQPDMYLLARAMDNLDYSGYNVIVGHASGLSANDNTELDGLITEASETADFEARVDILQEVAAITCDEAYGIFVVNPGDVYGAADGVDFEMSPYGARYMRVASVTGS